MQHSRLMAMGDQLKLLYRKALALLRQAHIRRATYAGTALILAILCLFPRPYMARAKLLPQDSSSAGLGQVLNSLGGQFSQFASLLSGGRPPNDLYLIIGRSDKVTGDVITALKLVGPTARYTSIDDAKLALAKQVDVHLLLGGVVEVQAKTHDPEQSLRLTAAYVRAISRNVAALTQTTTQSKQRIIRERFAEARTRVAQTQGLLETFRRQYRLADAEQQLGGELLLRTNLQAQFQAKLVELRTIEQFAGPESSQLTSIKAELDSLRDQIARASRVSGTTAGPNAFALSTISGQYLNLYRDYRFAQALYEVYARASEQVAVEELVAQGATYIQIVEPVHLDPERQYNNSAIGLLVVVILLAIFTEIYAPATGLRWPAAKDDRHGDV